MIIAEALRRLFSDLTITYDGVERSVNYHQGDQKELIKWVIAQKNQRKYPLIWYTLAPYTEYNGWYETTSQLIIMQSTKIEWLNNTRAAETYTGVIEPTWQRAKRKLLHSNNVQVIGRSLQERFLINDQPSYGLDINNIGSNESDFKSLQQIREKSASIDYVDARIIKIHFKIKANCIN